jgi:hypothetical protein
MKMRTESAEYCAHLAQEVAQAREAAVSPPPDVDILREEGERLCGRGHVMGGIKRLRRALVMLRENQ